MYSPPQAMIRVSTVAGLLPTLRTLGLDPNEMLPAAGFDPAIFDEPDNLISFAARSRLLVHCARRAKCPHFGLLVGQHAGLHSFGLMGLLASYSRDAETALNRLVRYFYLHAHGVSVSLQVRGNTAVFAFRIHNSGAEGNDLVGDAANVVMFNILRELCGRDWKPTEIWAMHSKPDNIDPYHNVFRARLVFNAEQYGVVFQSSWLAARLPEVHEDVSRLVGKQIDLLASRYRDNFPEQVRTVLRATLLSGDVRAERVAALFSIHPRTLNRRLNVYGLGYQGLLDEIRFEMARQMLIDSDLKVSEVALILQYADARAFIQAFRRWSAGMTPAHWRAKEKRLRRITAAACVTTNYSASE